MYQDEIMKNKAVMRLRIRKHEYRKRKRLVCIQLTLLAIIAGILLCVWMLQIPLICLSDDEENMALQKHQEQVITECKTVDQKENLDTMECTQEIREFVEKYPESISLAQNYKNWHTKEPQDQLEVEDIGEGIPLLLQWDKRWAYEDYGDGILGTTGCGPTSLAMVYSGLTGKTDYSPARIARWAEKQGYYVKGIGTSWLLMSQGAENFGLNVKLVPISCDAVRNELEDEKVLICSMHAGDFTQSGHFIVLTGLENKNSVKIRDCNSISRSEKGWDISQVVEQMDACWSYRIEDGGN